MLEAYRKYNPPAVEDIKRIEALKREIIDSAKKMFRVLLKFSEF